MKPELFLRRGVVGLAVAVTAVAFGCAGEFDEGDAPEEGAEAATSDALTTTFKFQNGVAPTRDYAGTADAVLRQVAPTTAGGSATTIDVDYGDGSPNTSQVGVLRFDVRAIAPGSKVSSASITLRVTNATSGSTVYALHPLLKPWNEAQVTWRSASSSAAWSAGGARSAPDRSSATIGTLLPKSTGKVTIALNASGVALVQRWVDTPSNNFGVVIDTANNADGIAFDSSEAATAADRPLLTVGVESSAPAPARSYHLHPYASNSVWNQPLADGVTYESPTASATVNFRTPKGNVNYRPDWSLGIWYPGAKDATYPIQSADGATTYGAWPIPKTGSFRGRRRRRNATVGSSLFSRTEPRRSSSTS